VLFCSLYSLTLLILTPHIRSELKKLWPQ
jgi:hypothetical protein